MHVNVLSFGLEMNGWLMLNVLLAGTKVLCLRLTGPQYSGPTVVEHLFVDEALPPCP
jgi:hypothetical protein